MIFEKGQRAEIDGILMECILADEDYAALAPTKYVKKDKCWKANFNKVAIFSNLDEFKNIIPGLKFIGR